jgi:hypothetical protein
MDKIEKKWHSFLSENEEIPYQIYCDMDGVLVDLEAGIEETLTFADIEDDAKEQAIQVVNSGMLWQTLKKDPKFSKGAQAIFDILSKGTEAEREAWWANLPPRSDMPVLWNHIAAYNPTPIILSAPWLIDGVIDEACVRGKKRWIRNSLSSRPKEIIITPDKKAYAGPNHILIDDMDKYIGPWHATGGIAIKHVSASNSIEVLKKQIDKNI